VRKGKALFSYTARKRFLHLLAGTVLAVCFTASPALAKRHSADVSADKGGLFQPPAAIDKSSLVLDMVVPKAIEKKAEPVKQTPPPATVSTTNPAFQAAIIPVKAFGATINTIFHEWLSCEEMLAGQAKRALNRL
jgi:hypothetical protein